MRDYRTVAAVHDNDNLETALDRSADAYSLAFDWAERYVDSDRADVIAAKVADEVMKNVMKRPRFLAEPAELELFVLVATRNAVVRARRGQRDDSVYEELNEAIEQAFGVTPGGRRWVWLVVGMEDVA
jgi:hypothetical protein